MNLRDIAPLLSLRALRPLGVLATLWALQGCGGGTSTTPPPAPAPPPAVDYTPASARLAKQPLLDDLKAIASPEMEGRKLGSVGNAKARALIVQRFQTLGLTPLSGGFEQPFTWRGYPGTNVVGIVPGTTNPGRRILLTAHYDHIGTSNGAICPGADDNGSGTAALLQLAAWLKAHPPAHTVVLCLFDGEEAGLFGSRAFVAAPPFPLASIDVVLNLDMIAQGTRGRIFVGGTSYTAALKPYLLSGFSTSKVTVVPDFESYDAYSDQYPFWQAGIPFLFFCVGDDDPYYHTPADTFENIPQVFYWATLEAILDTFLKLDALNNLAMIVPHVQPRTVGVEPGFVEPHPWRMKALHRQ